MVVVSTIIEVICLAIRLFYNLERPLLYLLYICGINLFGCTICLVAGIATKAALLSPNLFTIF